MANSNPKERFIPNYNPVPLQEIADAAGYSKTAFWQWRKDNDIELPRGRVNYCDQKMIYQKLYGEAYDGK